MDNINEYIDVLIQAPIAVILMFYLYISNKLKMSFFKDIIGTQNKIITEITNALDEAIKIIKQQERK
jgi:hypothetical protein